MSNGGFKFDGKFSAGTGGAGAKDDDVVLTNSFGKVSLAAAADDDEDGDAEVTATLPRAVLKRVLALRNMHISMESIEEEYKKERIALEQKFLARREEQYGERHKVITGEVEPTIDASQLADAPEDTAGQEEVKGVPEFWSQCLLQHPATAEIIQEEDMPLLEKLSDIRCTYDETYSSFTLHFYFDENEYFTNKVLTKKYGVTPDLLDDKSPALTLNEGTDIEWKAGKNLTVTEIKKKQKAKSGKNKGQVRTVITQEPKASFFNYFSAPKPDDEDEEEEEEEEEDGIKLTTEEDYDIGHTIRTAIIPEAIMWYTGEADDGEDDEEDDEDDDEDEEEEEEEEESEEEEEEKPRGKKGAKKANKGGFAAPAGGAAAGGGAAGENPECKQN